MPARAMALVLTLGLAALAHSGGVREFGDREVHYSLFASDFLRPEVAAAYGIVRAADRAVLNIAIRRRAAGVAGSTAESADISGTRYDLVHRTALEFRTIEEEDAVYYLADFAYRSGETLYFELEIRPRGEPSHTLQLRFSETLYVD